MTDQQWVTVREFAELSGVSRRTILHKLKKGILPDKVVDVRKFFDRGCIKRYHLRILDPVLLCLLARIRETNRNNSDDKGHIANTRISISESRLKKLNKIIELGIVEAFHRHILNYESALPPVVIYFTDPPSTIHRSFPRTVYRKLKDFCADSRLSFSLVTSSLIDDFFAHATSKAEDQKKQMEKIAKRHVEEMFKQKNK